jgi:hypothetical protein
VHKQKTRAREGGVEDYEMQLLRDVTVSYFVLVGPSTEVHVMPNIIISDTICTARSMLLFPIFNLRSKRREYLTDRTGRIKTGPKRHYIKQFPSSFGPTPPNAKDR